MTRRGFLNGLVGIVATIPGLSWIQPKPEEIQISFNGINIKDLCTPTSYRYGPYMPMLVTPYPLKGVKLPENLMTLVNSVDVEKGRVDVITLTGDPENPIKEFSVKTRG